MNYRFVCACAVFVFAVAATSAQEKRAFSGKCGKSDVVQSIPAGDKDGHTFSLQKGKCETTTGDVGSAKPKSGAFAEHDENSGTHMKGWGVYTETFDSGDKIFYAYQTTGTTKDGAFAGGGNKYQMIGGTGKLKGIKGSGSCKLTAGDAGGLDYSCEGEYTLPAAAPAKKK
jgi:hypothetical protein